MADNALEVIAAEIAILEQEDAGLVQRKRGMASRRLDILNEINLLKKVAAQVQPVAIPDERDVTQQWRALALQFDIHRMNAMSMLRGVVAGTVSTEHIQEFLALPPPVTTKLYFCHATDGNGDSLDWFVEGVDADEALAFYEAALEDSGMNEPTDGVRIWELPTPTGNSQFINWHNDTPEDGRAALIPVVGVDPEA